MTVARRIKDDAIVSSASANFAAAEVSSVIDNPAEVEVIDLGGSCIASSPGDGGARRVDMDGFAFWGGECQGRSAGVGEEVEKGRRVLE